jgi:1,4-dihydroxy-6-naphthoate synthase
LTLAHSPDSDDAFMFYALSQKLVDSRGLEFRHELHDIETLNRRAEEGIYDITAISFHAYAYIADQYTLMEVGSSVGDNYGPIVVSNRSIMSSDLEEMTVAVPGERTTACLALKLFCPLVHTKVMPFDKIQPAVARGDVDAGLLIHEGQISFADQKLHRVVDLGEWWTKETGLPLPLGGNAIRRRLPRDVKSKCSDVVRDTIQYALDHRGEALDYALKYARGLDRQRADKFIGMYVNGYTLELGERGERAIELLLRLGHENGLLPRAVKLEFSD